MTVQATEPLYSDVFVSSGIELEFPFPFSAFRDTDVGVATLAPGAEKWVPLDYGADYTVGRNPAPVIGGKVFLPAPLASGWKLIAYANIEFSQDRKYENQSGLFLFEIEASLDKLTSMAKLLADDAARSPKTNRFTGTRGLELPEPAPGQVLVGREDGDGWANGPTGTEITNAETYANEAKAARDKAQQWADAAAVADGTLSSVAELRALPVTVDGKVVRVVGRQAGFFKWRAGDLTAEVASDPYGGLWVAPTSASSGASGAWQRMVEGGIYDAEWWLPDAMPTNAQTPLNAGILAIPDPYATFLMPRRPVLVTGPLRFAKGFTYQGAGEACPVDGQGGNFQTVYLMASNLRISNVSAGNVQGSNVKGENGGFHIFDGVIHNESLVPSPAIENVSVRDCHAYQAEMGIRAGFNLWRDEPGGPTTLRGSRDVYIENFHCNDIWRIGIELFRVEGVEVVAPVVRMAPPAVQSGFDRCSRIIGARNATFLGGRFIAAGTTACVGLSIEMGHTGSAMSRNITIEGVEVDGAGNFAQIGGKAENVSITGCRYVGRIDRSSQFLGIQTGETGLTAIESAARNIRVNNSQSSNARYFCSISGHVYGLDVENNTHTSNQGSDARFLHVVPGSSTETKVVRAIFRDNTALVDPSSTGGVVRIHNITADSDLTFAGNEFNPAAGGIWSLNTPATVKIPNADSNKALPNEQWALLRPAFGEGVVTINTGSE